MTSYGDTVYGNPFVVIGGILALGILLVILLAINEWWNP